MIWSLALAVGIWLFVAVSVARCIQGGRQIAKLTDIPPIDDEQALSVGIVVAARNEQRHVREAICSMLNVGYPDLRVVAVDDRSTDQTGAILDELAAADSRLHVVHINDLPEGWIGKNHALHRGAMELGTDLILFTDADVQFAPDAIRRAASYFIERELDHLTITPRVLVPGLLLKGFVVSFAAMFVAYFNPWKARDSRSSAYVGIGAFNLMGASAYHQLGGHEKIRMRPDDDLKLGKLVKQHGLRQDIVDGGDLISVPWYGSLKESAIGLEKNAFSGVDYSVATIVVGTFSSFLMICWPFLALLFTSGWTRFVYALTCLTLLYWGVATARSIGYPRRYGLLFPISVTILNVIQWRAMILTFYRGGIRWRDTHYSLAELRSNKV